MPKITANEISKIYELAIDVYHKRMSISEATDILQNNLSMNRNSADGYIRSHNLLFRGELITRTINMAATEHLLSNVVKDLGAIVSRNVVNGLWLHVDYYEKKTNTNQNSLRHLLTKFQPLIRTKNIFLLSEFDQEVSDSLNLSQADRLAKIQQLDGSPRRILIHSVGYTRSQHIVAERLFQAKGFCGYCGSPAPFNKKNGSPYLEVHHVIPLAERGKDSLENTIALCPNCHREAHLGIDWQKFRPKQQLSDK